MQILAKAKVVLNTTDQSILDSLQESLKNLDASQSNQFHTLLKIMAKKEEKITADQIPDGDDSDDDKKSGFQPEKVFKMLRYDYETDRLTYDEYINNPQIEFSNTENFKDLEDPSFLNDVKNYQKMKQKLRYFEFIFTSRVVAICDEYKNNPECRTEGDDELDFLKRKFGLIFGKSHLKKMKTVYAKLYKYERLTCVFNYQKYSLEEIGQLANYLKVVQSEKEFWSTEDEINEKFNEDTIVTKTNSITIQQEDDQ